MFSSNCCFLTCIQISQEAGQVVWYSHLFQNFLQFIMIYIVNFHALEKEMATHASDLAWRIPGMGEPGGLPSMGSHRVDTTEVT